MTAIPLPVTPSPPEPNDAARGIVDALLEALLVLAIALPTAVLAVAWALHTAAGWVLA